MSAYAPTAPTTNRRGFLKMTVLGVGGAIVLRALAVPELGDVVTGEHAVVRHDLDAVAVRGFFATSVDATILGQPPCKDGRFRLVSVMPNGAFAVWVLVRLGATLYQEVTAFATRNADYIRALRDDCGNGGYWGHGLYAQSGRAGDGIETRA